MIRKGAIKEVLKSKKLKDINLPNKNVFLTRILYNHALQKTIKSPKSPDIPIDMKKIPICLQIQLSCLNTTERQRKAW
jgi:hypothetical protein